MRAAMLLLLANYAFAQPAPRAERGDQGGATTEAQLVAAPVLVERAVGSCGREGRRALSRYWPLVEFYVAGRDLSAPPTPAVAAQLSPHLWPIGWRRGTVTLSAADDMETLYCIDTRDGYTLAWWRERNDRAANQFVASEVAAHGEAQWFGQWRDAEGNTLQLNEADGRWKILQSAGGDAVFTPGAPWLDDVSAEVRAGCPAAARCGTSQNWHITTTAYRPLGRVTQNAVETLIALLTGREPPPRAIAPPLLAVADTCAELGPGTTAWVRCNVRSINPITWGYSGYLLAVLGATPQTRGSWDGNVGFAGRFVRRRFLGVAFDINGRLRWHEGLSGEARAGVGLGRGFGLRRHGHVALFVGGALGRIRADRAAAYAELATLWPLGPWASLDLAGAYMVSRGANVWRLKAQVLVPVSNTLGVAVGSQLYPDEARHWEVTVGFGLRGR